ncbi:class II fumarate hydratase [Effusibacillus lacus]|uniref:Fumarate hydratase class II n=1 Tax=Effusibacillus lacus TaxID=1348429 RepID=A0A292YQX8_9BACL|nr:class II fumarate hydratase [Effusibacillus lacus]TCS74925.1 fumarase class II [Effusibacillus lacus]GAX91596.1 aspartate ammonia-lyase [Effusibacillus lacus]
MTVDYRISRDSLGEVRVPASAYYGAQTERARHNFPISGLRLPPRFIRAQGIIKRAAAIANRDVGELDPDKAAAIIAAAEEVIDGKFNEHFVVDVYQAGAGTSQNMNANEVIANRACEIMGGERGDTSLVHPNDHVNMAQSTNDTIHVAMNIAAMEAITHDLLPNVLHFEEELFKKARLWDPIIKSGRTHLQDAVPMRLGQEFGGYANAVRMRREMLKQVSERLLLIGLGGNAVGTGINAHPDYSEKAIAEVANFTGLPFRKPVDYFTFVQNPDAAVEVSGQIRALATTVMKIANDIRLLSSGPRTGLAEVNLPVVQPGSSIMPGKVNPVLPEMMNMICYQVFGCDMTVASAGSASQLELNVMMPVMAYNLLHAIRILATGIRAFTDKCIVGMEANEERCLYYAEMSTSVATALNPLIGYDRAAEIAKRAYAENQPVREIARAEGIPEEQLARYLNLREMTGK